MDDYRTYWDCPPEQAPDLSGASKVMDCSDIKDVLGFFGLDLSDKRVLDWGCGTGRLSQLCGKYVGYDISPGMVVYAQSQGIEAHLIEDGKIIWPTFDIVLCLSVFTHISREDRKKLLNAFLPTTPLLVDILPWPEDQFTIAVARAKPEEFEQDLMEIDPRINIRGWCERQSPDLVLHRYYYVEHDQASLLHVRP